MYTITLAELIFYSLVVPALIATPISWGGYYYTKYRLRRYREKQEAGRITVGNEVKLHTGPHEGKEGLVIARLTLITESGVHTEQAALITEHGELVLGEPLSNLEKIS